ncbi:MAG: hypothetical protein HN984_16655, partial [Marinovum sp.]|nr:hypothetical protein [Marinovum sp.]
MKYDGPNSPEDGQAASEGSGLVIIHAQGGSVQELPAGAWVLKAEFVREGPDLLLVGANGQKILIRDFFQLQNPPDLALEGGLLISAQVAVRLAGPLAPGEYAQGAPAGAAGPIGKVVELEGKATATRADGTKVELKEGDPVFQNDVIETDEDGAVGLEFADESTFSLGDSGRMVLDDMVYEPGGEDNSMGVSLVSGAFTFVSGQISKADPDAMALKTPVATIGIRGTSLAGKIGGEGEENSFSLLADPGGTVGEIVLTNDGGTVVLNQVGATVGITSMTQAPPAPVILSAEQLSSQYGKVMAVNPAKPQSSTSGGDNQSGEGGEQQGEGEGLPEGFKPPKPGSDFGQNTMGDLAKVKGLLEKARLDEMKLREGFMKGEKLFGKMNERFERDIDRRVDDSFKKMLKDLGPRLDSLTEDQSADAAPILALIQKAQAAATKASAAEQAAATKKAAVEAEVVAKGTAYGLDQSSANSLSSAITAPLDALGAASALAATASGVMLSAGAMLGSLSAGKTINPQLLATLEAAATETEVAAAQIDVAVKGSVAAMDSVVSIVINTVKSTSGSGKLAAAESMVVTVLATKINEKMAEEAAKVTDAPAGADLASMTVDKISTVVDKVQEKVAQAKAQIAALPAEEKTATMVDAFTAAEATASKAKESAEKATATITAKTAADIRANAEEALEAAKAASKYKEDAEKAVDFKAIVQGVDASIAAEALSAYEAFSEAELAVEAAATAISSADSSQELALDYVSGVLAKKKEALADGASDGSQGTVEVISDGTIEYTPTESKFVGNFVSVSASDAIDAGDTFSVVVSIGNTDTTTTVTASAGNTLANVQAKLATDINASSAINASLEAAAISRLELSGNFNEGDQFAVTVGGTTVTFAAAEVSSEAYTIADVRSGLIDAINGNATISGLGVADRGSSVGGINFALSSDKDADGKPTDPAEFSAQNISWTSPGGASHQAEYDISLLTLTDDVSFEAAASATGSGNSAKTYDIDTFVYSTKSDDGNLTAKQATVTVANSGGTIAAENSIIVTDLSDETVLAETLNLSSITASGSSQISTASTAADTALEIAANALLQVRADLVGKLVGDAMAKAKKQTYQEALAEATGRLTADLKDIFTGEDSADLGPLDPDLSVTENVAVNAAKVDGASDGTLGSTAVNNGAVTLNLTAALADGASISDGITISTQSGLITLTGKIEAGDAYRLTVDGYPVSYTVTAEDVAGGMTLNGAAAAFVAAINEDEDIKDILQATANADGSISLLPEVSGQPFIASVSAQNGEGNATDDNDAFYTDVFNTRDYTVTYTNDTGGSVSSVQIAGLKVVGAEQVSTYSTALSAAFPDNALLESQATLADQLAKNAALVETFSENFLGLFNSAITKVQASYDAAVVTANEAATELATAETALTDSQTEYQTAFDLAIDLKSDAANAASDLAAITAELAVGEAAARAQASVGLELSLEDVAESAAYASALTFGASNGVKTTDADGAELELIGGSVEVSDAGAISYTANEESLASLSAGESFVDTIYYSVQTASKSYSPTSLEVVVVKALDGFTISGVKADANNAAVLDGVTAKGAKQLASDATAAGLSAADARALHEEVDYLLGTEAEPGLVREHVTNVSGSLDGASGSVNLILGTLGIAADSAAAQSNPAAVEALASLAVGENYLAASSASLTSLASFETKADAFADLADAVEATANPALQGLNIGPQQQSIDPAKIAQAMIDSARQIAQNMAEGALNAEADAAQEAEKAAAQEATAAAAAATSAAEDAQAATEVLKALDETMASAAKVAGFTSGLKGTVEQLEGGGLDYKVDTTKLGGLENGATTTDTFFYASHGSDGRLVAHKATVSISLTNNVVEVAPGVQSEIFGGDGASSPIALTAIMPVGALQLATASEVLVRSHSEQAQTAEALDSIGDTNFDLDAARANSSVVASSAAAASLELATTEAAQRMASAAAREAEIAFSAATNSASGRNTSIQVNSSLASVFESAAATALSQVEALLESATSKATDAAAAKDLQAAEVEAKEFAINAAAAAASAEAAASLAARQVANQTIKDKVDADNAAAKNAKELADTAVAKAQEAAQKLVLTQQAAKDVDVDTAKVASEAAQQAADLAQAAAGAAIESAAGAGSEALAQASRAASAAIQAVTDAGAASASYEVAANATIAADGWVAGTATADRISAVNSASIAAGNAGKAN